MMCVLSVCIFSLYTVHMIQANISSVRYMRQSTSALASGKEQPSRSAIWCAQTCSKLPSAECHAYIYQPQSRMCMLLPLASITECSSNASQSRIEIMVSALICFTTNYPSISFWSNVIIIAQIIEYEEKNIQYSLG